MPTLSPRALRLVRAGHALHGENRWVSAMARTMRLSQTYISLMSSGAKPVTDEVEKKLLRTLQAERKRLRATSAGLAVIIDEINKEKIDG
jgi:hypothetical protein